MAHHARLYPDTFYVNGTPIPSAYFQSLDTDQSNGINGDTGQNNALVRNPVTNWTNGSTVTLAELEALDAALKSIINGDDGGTYAPQQQIGIGGSGLQVTGPVIVARGGTLTLSYAGNTIALNDNDSPEYGPNHVGRTRTFAQPCSLARCIPSFGWRARWSDGALQSIAPVIDQSDGNGPKPLRLWVPVRCVHGSTLTTLTVNFRVGWQHTQLPPNMPKARVVRMNASGQPVPLTSTASGADAHGFVAVTAPASPTAWGPSAGKQQLVIPCDQNNVIDITQYEYFVEIVEESGLDGYPWSLVALQPVKLAGDYAPTFGLGPAEVGISVDGVGVQPGDRVAIISHSWNFFNGVWIAAYGSWQPAPDFVNFSQGMLIPVQQGNGYGGTLLQVSSAIATWTNNNQPTYINTWSSGSTVARGSLPIIPTTPNGYYYTVQSFQGTATTGAIEPTWPTTVGGTVIDNAGANQIVWQCAGKMAQPMAFVAQAQQDTETAQLAGSALFAHGNIWQSVVPTFTGIESAAWQ